MWNRTCPLCFVKVRRSLVLARSSRFQCPACGKPLELSRITRLWVSAAGLFGAALSFHWLASHHLGWLPPVAAGILGFSLFSALSLALASDLVAPSPPHSR